MLPHMVRYTAFTHLAADNPLLKHNFYAISSSFLILNQFKTDLIINFGHQAMVISSELILWEMILNQ